MGFLASYIMRGRLQAMIVASTLVLLSLKFLPLGILSSAAIALVTLRKGAQEGLYVMLFAIAAAGILGFFIIGDYRFILLYGVVVWLPVWLISIVLREGRNLILTVEITVLIGVIGVVGYYFFNNEPSVMWKHVLLQMVPAEAPADQVEDWADTLSSYMTGVVAAGSVFGLLFGLLIGRWWQAQLYNPGGFRKEYLSLYAPRSLAIASLGIVVLAAANTGIISEVAWNVTILLFVLYIFIGIAVLHSVFSTMAMGRYFVPMLYITLLLVPHAWLPVALIGLSDTWLKIRQKNLNQTGT